MLQKRGQKPDQRSLVSQAQVFGFYPMGSESQRSSSITLPLIEISESQKREKQPEVRLPDRRLF